MTPRPRSDVPALVGGVLVVLVTAGLPLGWRAGLALAVAGLLAGGPRWRAPSATAGGLLLLVAVAALTDAPVAAGVVALVTGAVTVGSCAALGAAPPPAVDLRAHLARTAPVAVTVLCAAPVAVLVRSGAGPTAGWAVTGGAVLVVGLLLATSRGPAAHG